MTDEAEVADDIESEEEDNVRPLRPQRPPPRPGNRRTSITSSTQATGEDAKAMMALSRTIEVEGASDRLGLSAVTDTLESSEKARRGLTEDLALAKERHQVEVDDIREEYGRAFDAMEARHEREARRWRDDRDKLRKEIERLEGDVKVAKKAKKKHKKSVQEMELKIATMREEGAFRRTALSVVAPGVPPLANKLAEHLPDIARFIRSTFGSAAVAPAPVSTDDATKDRAAAIRFAGNLFSPQNQDIVDDLKRLAEDVIIGDGGKTVIVSEWERVERYIWSALQRDVASQAPVDSEPSVEQVEDPNPIDETDDETDEDEDAS